MPMLPAQQLIVHQRPIRLRHLAGVIVNPKGETVAYASVELRNATDNHLLASAFADGNGKFLFADRKRGDQLQIRVSLKGFNPVQYSISEARIGEERIRVVLPPLQ